MIPIPGQLISIASEIISIPPQFDIFGPNFRETSSLSANDFQDVVTLLKRQRQVNNPTVSDQQNHQFETDYNDIAELTLVNTEARQHPLEDYVVIMESAK
ncbi:hypothetical protein [Niallia endozanthoxylica]|uniref:Uncharacterized protein n=1 Tax=Niallia endozanthoxylica TaxID=2036016 RepID=A0A5J5HPQ2_9BACI|nr:hypothetical protein [Niallia endozanthoxylica]KAA9022934.1 hypothetical protein F4V44_14450 [Niallia endozanthoxylica]